jgi:MipA family protein
MRLGLTQAALSTCTVFLSMVLAGPSDAGNTAAVSTLNFSFETDPAPDWIVTLGAGVEYGPRYEGASRLGFSFVPSDFDIRRAGEPASFGAPDDGFSFSLFDAHGLSLGPVADYRGGRSRGDDQMLVGLHDISPTLDAGLFAEYWVIEDRLRTRVELRQALRARYGLVADLSADWVQPFDAFTFSFGPRMSMANGAYMRTYFGISDEEAAASPFVGPFDASSGIQSVGAIAALSYQMSPAWKATIYDKYDRLVKDAAESPITSVIGSPNQNIIGVNLSYAFGVKF